MATSDRRGAVVLTLLVVCAVPISQAQSVYVTPDTPTSPDGPTSYFPWQIARHSSLAAPPYALELTLPGAPRIDALHKLDVPGSWLFSVALPSDLGGALDVHPEDVVRYDSGALSLFFDGSCVTPAVPPSSNLDALTLSPDNTRLSVAFDVATDVGGATIFPAGFQTYDRTGGGPCDWAPTGGLDFRTLSSTYYPGTARITALAFLTETRLLVSFDISVDLAPSAGPVTILPGQIAVFDATTLTWDLFEDLHVRGTPGWPVSSVLNALSCQTLPGKIDPSAQGITLNTVGSDVEIHCAGSCSSGAESFGIYQGTLASLHGGVYDHVQIDCAASCPGANVVQPGAGDRYYLMVPHNYKAEGGYGLAGPAGSMERPQAADPADRCTIAQSIAACP